MEIDAMSLMLCLGHGKDGNGVYADLMRMPHLLILGKADRLLSSLICQLASCHSPEEMRTAVISESGLEELCSLPHLLFPVLRNAEDAEAALRWAVDETDRRYALFAREGVYNIERYNREAQSKLYLAVIAIDGIDKLTENGIEYIARIGAKSRAAGIHLIACTDKATAKAIPAAVKANIPSRIALKTENAKESRLILDTAGAELLEKDDVLFSPIGAVQPTLLAPVIFTEAQTAEALGRARRYGTPALIDLPRPTEKRPRDVYAEALELTAGRERVSIALLMRALKIGYAKAAGLMEKMEKEGYVGPYNGSKPRKVLVSSKK